MSFLKPKKYRAQNCQRRRARALAGPLAMVGLLVLLKRVTDFMNVEIRFSKRLQGVLALIAIRAVDAYFKENKKSKKKNNAVYEGKRR